MLNSQAIMVHNLGRGGGGGEHIKDLYDGY